MDSLPEGLYPLYKRKGPTSRAFMNEFRDMNSIPRDVKLGYAGTLDPLAEGILVIGVGRKYTKQLQAETDSDKSYRATIYLNGKTDSGDADGPVHRVYPKDIPTDEQVSQVCAQMEGDQMQVPSAYSAKKIDGTRAYDLVRSGLSPELRACPITIHSIEIIEYEYPVLKIEVNCSKGTFIRVLAQQIGDHLTGGGYLTELIRVMSGEYDISDVNWAICPK